MISVVFGAVFLAEKQRPFHFGSHAQNASEGWSLFRSLPESKYERKAADIFAVASGVCDRAQRRLFDALRGEQNDEEKSGNPCRHVTEQIGEYLNQFAVGWFTHSEALSGARFKGPTLHGDLAMIFPQVVARRFD